MKTEIYRQKKQENDIIGNKVKNEISYFVNLAHNSA